MSKQEDVRLGDWLAAHEPDDLTYQSVGGIAGWRHDPAAEDDEDVLDLAEAVHERGWDDFTGSVEGRVWTWDGEGHPYDARANCLISLQVRVASHPADPQPGDHDDNPRLMEESS
jgi:hypothetical protein